jgi:hypothetical protein
LLGTLFIVLVLFVPGGVAGAVQRLRRPSIASTETG